MNCRWPLVAAALAFFVGCSGGGSSNSTSAAVVTPTPAPPTLGVAIDRVGRPAILTALVSAFEPSTPRGVNRDAYNGARREDWIKYTDDVRVSLGLYDGLDGQCGNQLASDLTLTGPFRYNTLAFVLTDDRLYLNSTSNSCSQYLGVELDVTELSLNSDCGGRTPTSDVIGVSYSAIINDLSFFVTQGVTSDNVVQSNEFFPFLAAFVPPQEPL